MMKRSVGQFCSNPALRASRCTSSWGGSVSPILAKNCSWRSNSGNHSSGLMAIASSSLSFDMSKPERSKSAARGMNPMGVSSAATRPRARSTIHLSTRMFSLYPGQRKEPSRSFLNQFTMKMRGGCLSIPPIASQWEK